LAKNNILKVEGISVSYGQVRALRHVSLEVNQGEIVALIGANGAGKSTLVGAVLGINRVSSGTIRFMGEDITRTLTERIVASGICLIPEGRGILPLMTVLENLQLGAYHLKADINQYLERAYHRFPVLKSSTTNTGDNPREGSSNIISLGADINPRPTDNICCSPPLIVPAICLLRSPKTGKR